MSTQLLLAWTLVSLLGVLTPGIDVMMVIRSTVFNGRRTGFAAVLGIQIGTITWAVAGLAGLTALLAASELAYGVVRIGGACYLIWLGCTAIWKSLPRNRKPADDVPENARSAPSGFIAARRALLSNLLNPKIGVFYISILPQFLPAAGTTSAGYWGLVLVAIHLAIGTAWLSILVLVGVRARGILTRERVKAWLDRTTAAVMIGLGVRLATEHR